MRTFYWVILKGLSMFARQRGGSLSGVQLRKYASSAVATIFQRA